MRQCCLTKFYYVHTAQIVLYINAIIILGSLESPLAASPAQSYHPSSTYFHQQCQWFFDPPPSRQLILKISTAQKMGKSESPFLKSVPTVLVFWFQFY